MWGGGGIVDGKRDRIPADGRSLGKPRDIPSLRLTREWQGPLGEIVKPKIVGLRRRG